MTTLIKNVSIIDGTGAPARKADVFVSGDKISAIGSFPGKKAREVVDGQGAYLAPGFIDVANTADHFFSLFTRPDQCYLLQQGITTAIGGHDGVSLAPLLYGDIDLFSRWTNTGKININWHGFGEFIAAFAKKKHGVNFLSLVGYSTLHEAIAGVPARALTKNEQAVFLKVLEAALSEGAAGLSVDLADEFGLDAPRAWLKTLAAAIHKKGKVVALSLDADRPGSWAETLKFCAQAEGTVVLDAFLPLHAAEGDYERLLADIETTPNVYLSISPAGHFLTPLSALLPFWLREKQGTQVRETLRDPWWRARILKDLPDIAGEDLLVAAVPDYEALAGHTLRELRELRGQGSNREALLDLLASSGARGAVALRRGGEEFLTQVLAHPRSLVGSRTVYAEHPLELKDFVLESATSTFPLFLHMCEAQGLMPLEEGIRKLTAVPARLFGLPYRGQVREGRIADLTIFRRGRVEHVLVAGRSVLRQGAFLDVLAGRPLRATAQPQPHA